MAFVTPLAHHAVIPARVNIKTSWAPSSREQVANLKGVVLRAASAASETSILLTPKNAPNQLVQLIFEIFD